ncbi:MAG: hypothetical protein MUC88_28325 [Planctomycetes bacterium]|jgi:hypothetical protein|nr:hypothetical protein [Planctomycetota bacterium]
MKRSTMIAVGVLFTMAVAWAAYGQAGGGGERRGGFGRMGEAQQKAIADLQEQVAKLKTFMDQGMKAAQGRNYQDMSDEERTKMREEFTKRNEEQAKIMAAIQQSVDRLRMRQMAAEYNESMTALKDAQASAQKEKATETAQKLGQIIAQREKQMTEKVEAMGMTMDDLQKMGQRRGRQQ